MSQEFLIYGSELSPYSIKVRSYFRYSELPHQWIIRGMDKMDEFNQYAKLPLIPLVVTPEEKAIQDSTPIIEKMEAQSARLTTGNEALDFIAALLEEYADEWGNKHMFHYRWWYEENQISCAERIATEQLGAEADPEQIKGVAKMVQDRMSSRLSFVGSNEQTKPIIEGSFTRLLTLLNTHLENRGFIFGGKPSMGDLGLSVQLHQAYSDPYCQPLMQGFPKVLEWIERMQAPKDTGPLEEYESLISTLLPILTEEVGALFLPWSHANAKALLAGEKEFTVTLAGDEFTQEVQKYHAKSLGVIREKYAQVSDKTQLDALLKKSGCLDWLQ